MSLFQSITNLFNGQAAVVQAFLVILVSSIIYFIEIRTFKRLKVKAEATRTNWDEALLKAVHKPLGLLIWFLGVSYAIDILRIDQNGAAILHAITSIRAVVVIGLIVWFLIRLIREVEWVYTDSKKVNKREVDKTTVNAISQVLRAAVIITAALVLLQTLGYSISGILTLGGVGGLVAGFAAKDLLSNFFGGLMIYFDRPFKVGDWIRSPDRNIEGTVENIGWRLCRVRTFDKRPLYIPNSIFSNVSVENPSRMHNRRIKTHVGVRYDDAPKLSAVIADIKAMLQHHPAIDTKQTLMVNFVEFGPSSLNFMVYTFTKTTNWAEYLDVQQEIFLKIIDIITAHGAECAFPTTTIEMKNPITISNPKTQPNMERAL